MSIVGKMIAHYAITDEIGRGGMGEVYLATDTKLKRKVAIKVLADALAGDEQHLARLTREAEVLASLDHPGIGQIYGIEDTGGGKALVLQLIEGPTLADRIKQGPMAVEEALPIALKIAEALEAAHEKGVIHRDLKPANIKITPEGKIKILDFGLAKTVVEEEKSPQEIANSPTLAMPATQAGIILGTAAYMSPEQARAQAVDKRSDIFSFGALLYEMLTGKRVFQGEDTSLLMAAVLTQEPELGALPADAPLQVQRLIDRCLEKNPRNRLRDMGDARIELQEALEAPETGARARPVRQRPALGWTVGGLGWLVAVAAILTLLAGRTWSPEDATANLMRLSLRLPPGASLRGPPVVAPDGRRVAYAASIDGTSSIWLHDLSAEEASPLDDSEGGANYFWSLDGRRLLFESSNQLVTLDMGERRRRNLARLPWRIAGRAVLTSDPFQTGDMGANGDLLLPGPDGLYHLPGEGRELLRITQREPTEGHLEHGSPRFLPDGNRFLFAIRARRGSQVGGIYISSLDGSLPMRRVYDGLSFLLHPDGYMLGPERGGALWTRRIDFRTLAAEPFEAMDSLIQNGFGVGGRTLVFQSGFAETDWRLQIFGRDGSVEVEVADSGDFYTPRLSPDGQRFALEVHNSQRGGDLEIYDLARRRFSRLTFDPANHNAYPVWSADGTELLYGTSRTGGHRIRRTASSGAGQEEIVEVPLMVSNPVDWSRDGNWILYETRNEYWEDQDLAVLPLDGGEPRPYLEEDHNEAQGVFSPDGKWIAYVSDETGQPEIYLRPFPMAPGKWQISSQGGIAPRWRRDGQELFYLDYVGTVMAVPMDLGGDIPGGTPEVLFRAPVRIGGLSLSQFIASMVHYDVSADGRRFLMVTGSDTDHLSVILDWQELVK